jgi:hypothetical protein
MGLITQTAREYYEGHQLFTGDGSTTTFTLTFTPLPSAESEFRVFINGSEIDNDLHSYNSSTGVVTFTTAPANNAAIKILLDSPNTGNYRYIPLADIVNNFIISYIVDGKIFDHAR